MAKPQKQFYYDALRQAAERDLTVMSMINCPTNPLTKEDLHRCADRWPERWERYRHLLDKAPGAPS